MNKKWSKPKIIMNVIAIISTILTIILFTIHKFVNIEIIEILSITFLTISFHFDIRLAIGSIVSLFKSRINVNNKWFKLNKIENKLYEIMRVKKCKSKAPTYEPDEFSTEKHSLEELVVNMCNSEIVHTINVLISYLPLIFIIWFGSPIVFILTSILASIYDLQFVIIQRYNRPRVMKIMKRKEEYKLHV